MRLLLARRRVAASDRLQVADIDAAIAVDVDAFGHARAGIALLAERLPVQRYLHDVGVVDDAIRRQVSHGRFGRGSTGELPGRGRGGNMVAATRGRDLHFDRRARRLHRDRPAVDVDELRGVEGDLDHAWLVGDHADRAQADVTL